MTEKLLRNSIEATVSFASLLTHGQCKVKMMETHAHRPWTITADSDDRIAIWDISTKQRLMHESLLDLPSRCSRSGGKSRHQGLGAASTLAASVISQPSASSSDITPQAKRINLDRTRCGLLGRMPHQIMSRRDEDLICLQIELNKSSAGNTTAHPSNQQALRREDDVNEFATHRIRRITFIDPMSIENTRCSNVYNQQRSQLDARKNKSADDNINYGYSNQEKRGMFHTDYKIMIVFESCIMFYDFKAKCGSILAQEDLLMKTFSYAEFVADNLLAIGCSDGGIRIWDCMACMMIKALDCHGKGSIVLLKNLCISSILSNHDDHSNSDSLSDEPSLFMRLLSVGSDGNGFLWEGQIIGNIITCDGKTPSAKLEGSLGPAANSLLGSQANLGSGSLGIGGNSNVFIDSETMSLGISNIDRTLSVWSLGDSKTKATATSGPRFNKQKSFSKRSSFLPGGDQFADIKTLKRVRKIKPSSQLPSSLQKYISVSPVYCPRFIGCSTFAVASKSNTIALLQTIHSLPGEEGSERSSAIGVATNNNDVVSERLHPIYEISIAILLERYLNTSNQSSEVVAALKKSIGESDVKISSVQTHRSFPCHFILSSNVGIILVAMDRSQSDQSIARHPLWGNYFLHHSPGTISKAKMSLHFSSADTPRTAHSSESQQLEDDYVVIDLENGARFSSSLVSDTSQLYSFESLPSTPASDTISGLLSPATLSYKIGVSRPVFHVSLSGKYCAVHWPDNFHYILFRVNIARTGREVHNKSMVELERGLCQCFAWLGTQDIFALKIPTRRISSAASAASAAAVGGAAEQSKNRRASINIFQTKQEDTRCEYKPASMIFKRVHEETNSVVKINVVNVEKELPGDSVGSLFDGLLLGCNVLLSSTYTQMARVINNFNNTNSNSGDGNAFNPEQEAFASKSYSPDYQKLKFFALVPVPSTYSSSSSASTAAVPPSKVAMIMSEMMLVTVEPAMPFAYSVMWDAMTGYCAIDADHVLNIIQLKRGLKTLTVQQSAPLKTKGKIAALTNTSTGNTNTSAASQPEQVLVWSLSSIQSIPHNLEDKVPCSMIWHRGMLVVSSTTRTVLICTHFPFRMDSSLCSMQIDNEAVEFIVIASSLQPTLVDPPSPSESSLSAVSYRPAGLLEAIGIHQGHILLMSPEGIVCQAIPLAGHKLALSAFLLSFGSRYLDLLAGMLHPDSPALMVSQVINMLLSRGVGKEWLMARHLKLPEDTRRLLRSQGMENGRDNQIYFS